MSNLIDRYKLVTSNRDALIEQLDFMLSMSEAVEVVAKPWKDKRSISQNSLYWMWVKEISDQATVNDQKYNKDVWHEYFKRYLCPVKVMAMPAGDDLELKSTTMLDTGEMNYFLSRIEQWAQSHFYKLTIPFNCEYQVLKDRQEA